MSKSVEKALEYYDDPETRETRNFISHFDRFFDCLNGRHMKEGMQKRKPDLRPYRSSEDNRLKVNHPWLHYFLSYLITYVHVQWLEEDFLGFLAKWKKSVDALQLKPSQKSAMQLSRQTLEGLHITG